jgi:hypothetical protein
MRLPQAGETWPSIGEGHGFRWCYAYARSADTRRNDDVGQDYLAFEAKRRVFAFALCDGVGQSFFGDVAARFLGDALIQWLLSGAISGYDRAEVQTDLKQYLSSLTGPASLLVEQQAIPADAAPLLKDVLEQKKALGSESMFICGRIDLPGSSECPTGRIVLAWMGDSRLRVWSASAERSGEFAGTFRSVQRWSTRRGVVGGDPEVLVEPLDRGGADAVTRVAAYSDGLAVLDQASQWPGDRDRLRGLMEQAGVRPDSDDISFLDIVLQPAAAAPVTAPVMTDRERVPGGVERSLPATQTSFPGPLKRTDDEHPSGPERAPRRVSAIAAVIGLVLGLVIGAWLLMGRGTEGAPSPPERVEPGPAAVPAADQ